MNSALYRVIVETTPQPTAYLDCNCACPRALPSPSPARLPEATVVERHPQQRTIPLDTEFSAVFVPSLSHVAVVDRAAGGLLARLETPRSLAALGPAEAGAARRLLAAGVLRRQGAPDPRPAPPDELIAWLHVTNACNLRCTYCYLDKTDEAMSAETAFAAIDAVFRSARLNGYRRVVLKYAGGEASLNLPLVARMHRYAGELAAARAIELDAVVLSNGVGLTRPKLQWIKDLGLRLMISLDGPREHHDAQRPTLGGQGSYRAATRSSLLAHELGLALNLSITVTGASVAGLPAVVGWALDNELRFAINFYRENDCSASLAALRLDEQRLIEGMRAAYQVVESRLPAYSLLGCLIDRANLGAAHSRTCAVGENYLVIDHRGAVAKCQMDIARPLTDIRAPDALQVIRLDQAGVQNPPVEQKEGCRGCEWRYWCTGGCAVATFRATGRYDVQSPNCGIYKALYPEVVRLEGLRLLKWLGYQEARV